MFAFSDLGQPRVLSFSERLVVSFDWTLFLRVQLREPLSEPVLTQFSVQWHRCVCVCIGSLSIYIGKQYTCIMQLSFNATFNLAQGSRNLGETPSWPCALIPKELKSMKMRYSSVWTSRRFSFCSALVKSGTPWRPVKLVSINHYTGSVMKTFRCVQQNSSNEVL